MRWIKRFVLWELNALVGEGVIWSDGSVVLKKEGADFEIYASLDRAREVYRPERGFKLALEPSY